MKTLGLYWLFCFCTVKPEHDLTIFFSSRPKKKRQNFILVKCVCFVLFLLYFLLLNQQIFIIILLAKNDWFPTVCHVHNTIFRFIRRPTQQCVIVKQKGNYACFLLIKKKKNQKNVPCIFNTRTLNLAFIYYLYINKNHLLFATNLKERR